MYSRPKPGETQDDLLRMQEEFFKNKSENKINLAATVVSDKKSDGNEPNVCKIEETQIEIEEQLANTFEAVPTDIKLKNVEERQTTSKNISKFKFNSTRGFPQAKRRDGNIKPGNGSIFSQHIKRLKKEETPMEIDLINESNLVIKERTQNETASNISKRSEENLPSKSYVLSSEDSTQIHEENLNKIKSMTEEEILEEREKLIATMDPAIVAFLKARRKKELVETRNPTIKQQNAAAENISLEEIDAPIEVLSNPGADKWLNFNVVEANKLAWMKSINVTKIDKTKLFEARFDFEGCLLPYSALDISEKNRILFHHGEEPDRPGYTLPELFQLSRSSVIQQKIVALNCIANILSLNSTGVYSNIIDVPLEQIFFVVRFCLDDNTPAVLNAAIKAMRNLVYFQLDETCLDNLLGFGLGVVQPVLAVDNDMEDDNTVNDQQLAETNLVKCLIRSEILVRIRYIINTVKPPLETIVYCLEILIRLSRDSTFILNKIIECHGLIESIVKNFLPLTVNFKDAPYNTPLIQAVKLFRVLFSRDKEISVKLVNKYKILDAMSFYLSDETFLANATGLKLQIECMHLWSLLLHYNLSPECFSVLDERILLRFLDYHFKNTDLNMNTTLVRQGHLSSVLVLIGRFVKSKSCVTSNLIALLLEQCVPKWFAQFTALTSFSCGKLQIISSLIISLSNLTECCTQFEKIDASIENLINSEGFNTVTNTIKNGSMLLNNCKTHKPDNNLKSLETAAWKTVDHVVPIFQTNSCLPFLHSLSRYLRICNNSNISKRFFNHKNIQKYLKSLRESIKYFLTDNWFTRTESFLIMNFLMSSVLVKDDLDTSVFYELAVKCLGVFNSEQKPDIEYVLNNIIFSTKFYPSDILMKHLDIGLRNDSLQVSLNNLGEVLDVYTQVLGLKTNLPDFSTKLCIDVNIGSVIPIDWIYTPIIVLYSNQLQNKITIDETRQVYVIKNCLRWILIYETYFPNLAESLNPTDRFCRLACVFLGSDSLFLSQEIHELLERCFKNVAKFTAELNFKKEIQGLSNFQDFYTQLLEQYQSVSYGDKLFGNVILLPLAQKHDVQYRKTLWSEYMGAVQIFSVTPDEVMVNLELFLEPSENDVSLLMCYKRAIGGSLVRKNTVLYEIAKHHVEQFILSQKK